MAGKILIVDDTAVNRIVLKVKLGRAHYLPQAACDGASALAALAADPPALVLLDMDLPDMPGLAVLARIRGDGALRDLPVIMLTADTAPATRLSALAAGADDILAKPLDEDLLLARIRSLLRRGAGGPATSGIPLWDIADPPAPFERPGLVAVVSHRSDLRHRLARDLAQRTGHSVTPLTRDEVLAQTGDMPPLPEAFVIDADSLSTGPSTGLFSGPSAGTTFAAGFGAASDFGAKAGASATAANAAGAASSFGAGLHFISELRSRAASTHCGVVLLCDGPKQAATAFDMGVDDVAPANADPAEIALRLMAVMRRTRTADARRKSLQEGLRLAVTDPLTGLHNLRYAERELGQIADRARHSHAPFALLFIDLDRFKQVNDRFGHATGDLVLIAVARAISATLRSGDMLARIGGEEFLLALPGLDLDQARAVAERLCETVRALHVRIAGPSSANPDVTNRSANHTPAEIVRVTVSIGLAIGTGTEPVKGLRDRADRALLMAKSKGRNRVATDRHAA